MDGQVIDVNGTSIPYPEKYNRRASEKRLARARNQMETLRAMLRIELDDEEAYVSTYAD
jgi:hypothetical protein